MKNKTKYIIATILCLLLSGCAESVHFNEAAAMPPVGFWHGLWHGTILPFAWFVSLFNSDVAIYAVYNNGGWYDFGFALGVGSLKGTFSSSSKK